MSKNKKNIKNKQKKFWLRHWKYQIIKLKLLSMRLLNWSDRSLIHQTIRIELLDVFHFINI